MEPDLAADIRAVDPRGVLGPDALAERLLARGWYKPAETPNPAQKVVFLDERDPGCVERWDACSSGDYGYKCCRSPKSCSAGNVKMGVQEL